MARCYTLAVLSAVMGVFVWLTPVNTFAEEKPLVFGIISNAEPSRIYPKWQPFADYLAEKTGRSVKILIPRGFEKLVEAIDKGEIDIFYINSFVYYKLHERNKAKALAQMQNLNSSNVSHSVVIVRSDSGVKSLQQLKGEKVAFVSRMGAGGYLAPRALFYKEGLPTSNAVQEEFTDNLTSSLHKVLLGDVKAASMCGLNYKLLSEKIDTGELKIIANSDEYAEDVFGARPDLNAQLQDSLIKAVLSMDQSPKGLAVIAGMRELKVQKFVKYDSDRTEPLTRRLIEMGKM